MPTLPSVRSGIGSTRVVILSDSPGAPTAIKSPLTLMLTELPNRAYWSALRASVVDANRGLVRTHKGIAKLRVNLAGYYIDCTDI